ncbi:MAG: NF038132 family protein [Betaproteobacteria bacterium]|nr:NF038132 family protein [Betaproteobacteria bacterium]MCL2887090.1 NF038132 family protein [Betaproteobacteria bacterium]
MKNLTYSTAVVVLACGLAASASASECSGNCGTLGADGVVTASPMGGDYQYVSTNGGLNYVGSLGISGVNQTNGSLYVSDSFSVLAGDSLQFYFNYITSDGSGSYTDYAWAALRPTNGGDDIILFTARTTPTGNTVPGFGLPGLADGVVLDPDSTPIIAEAPVWSPLGGSSGVCFSVGCGYTGWIGMDYLFADAGIYSLLFGVTNVGDSSYDSGLAFAGLTINNKPIDEPTVPEPASMALVGLGLLGLGLARRRKLTA